MRYDPHGNKRWILQTCLCSQTCFTEQQQQHKHTADNEGRASLLWAVMLIQATLKFTLSYVLSVIHAYKSRRNYHNYPPRQNRTYSPKANFTCLDDTPAYLLFHWSCSLPVIGKKKCSFGYLPLPSTGPCNIFAGLKVLSFSQNWASHSLTFPLSSKSSHYRAPLVILSSLSLLSLIFSKRTKWLLNFGRQNWKHYYSSARCSTQELR